MIYLMFIFLSLVHALPWVNRHSARMPLNPYKLCGFLSAVSSLPYFLLVAWGYRSDVLLNVLGAGRDFLLVKFALMYCAGLLFVYLGIAIAVKVRFANKPTVQILSWKAIAVIVVILLAIYCYATYDKIEQSGGVAFVLLNIAQRTEIIADTGILGLMIQPIAFLIPFFLISSYGAYRRPALLIVFLVIAFVFLSLSIYGGRKAPMFVVVFSILSYHVYVRPIKIFSPAVLVVAIGLAVYFIGMLQFRASIDITGFSNVQVVQEAVRNMSYIDTYVFIIDHFDRNGFWFGANFYDLLVKLGLTRFSNISIPLDDGAYVRTLYEGWHVFPPMSYDQMYRSSWPPETFGNGYLNFGFTGVVLFSLFRGIVVGACFAAARRSGFSELFYFSFLFAAFNFHLTNLRIIQFAIGMAPAFLIYVLLLAPLRMKFRGAWR